MKRFHVHVSVESLSESIRFYGSHSQPTQTGSACCAPTGQIQFVNPIAKACC